MIEKTEIRVDKDIMELTKMLVLQNATILAINKMMLEKLSSPMWVVVSEEK